MQEGGGCSGRRQRTTEGAAREGAASAPGRSTPLPSLHLSSAVSPTRRPSAPLRALPTRTCHLAQQRISRRHDLHVARAGLALRPVPLAAQPAPNQQISLSFDHTGGLTGSVKAAVNDGLSARIFGTIDLNRQGGGRAGLDVTYDVPQ